MLPPGPRTPAFWQTLRFGASPREYSLRMIRRYGPVTRFRALNGDGVAVADPELAREVFAADPSTFETVPALGQRFGNLSVLATHGPTHKRQRKLLNPRFHGARVKTFLDTPQHHDGPEARRPGAGARGTDRLGGRRDGGGAGPPENVV